MIWIGSAEILEHSNHKHKLSENNMHAGSFHSKEVMTVKSIQVPFELTSVQIGNDVHKTHASKSVWYPKVKDLRVINTEIWVIFRLLNI